MAFLEWFHTKDFSQNNELHDIKPANKKSREKLEKKKKDLCKKEYAKKTTAKAPIKKERELRVNLSRLRRLNIPLPCRSKYAKTCLLRRSCKRNTACLPLAFYL